MPHKEKLLAAMDNPKAKFDLDLLKEAYSVYGQWTDHLHALTSVKTERIVDMVRFLNEYKDFIEIELIAKRGSDFLNKLDNSILEEFLIYLIHPAILDHLPTFQLETGP